jgi:hypothetical protein
MRWFNKHLENDGRTDFRGGAKKGDSKMSDANNNDAAGKISLQGDPTEPIDDQEDSRHEGALAALLPWAVSTLFHVALVLMAVWLVWWTITNQTDDDILVPTVVMLNAPERVTSGGRPNPFKPITRIRPKSSTNKTPTDSDQKIKSIIKIVNPLIGLKGGGPAAPWTGSTGRNGNTAGIFEGPVGGATRVAFLIDASGSLIDTLPFVITELKKSINTLREKQEFTVIFFQGDQVIEIPPRGLKPAIPSTKIKAMRWIDPGSGHVVPHGKTNPLAGVKKALSYRPQLLFILSDNITGSGQNELDQETVVAQVRKANIANTRINTIQFLYPDSLTRFGKQPTLKIISNDSGGTYKFVDRRSLGLE